MNTSWGETVQRSPSNSFIESPHIYRHNGSKLQGKNWGLHAGALGFAPQWNKSWNSTWQCGMGVINTFVSFVGYFPFIPNVSTIFAKYHLKLCLHYIIPVTYHLRGCILKLSIEFPTMMMYCAGVWASSHPLWVVWAVVCWVILTCMWWV